VKEWLRDLWHRFCEHRATGSYSRSHGRPSTNYCSCGGEYDYVWDSYGHPVVLRSTCVRALRYQRMMAKALPSARAL